MDRYRAEAMFYATDGSGGRHFREIRFEASSVDAAVREAERVATAPAGMALQLASLSDTAHGTIWSLPLAPLEETSPEM